MVVELVVTGAVCLFLSFALVAITIHSFTRKQKNREQESLLHYNSRSGSNKRYQRKIRIQKTSMIPAKHLRSLSVEFKESPSKHLYKYPQQHYRRKSTPNMLYIPKNKQQNDTMINIYPNFKCDKLFSLHQVQPMTSDSTGTESSGYSSASLDSKSSSPCNLTTGSNLVLNTKSNYNSPNNNKASSKPKHLFMPEAKEYFTEYFGSKKPPKISTAIYKEYEKKYNFVKE